MTKLAFPLLMLATLSCFMGCKGNDKDKNNANSKPAKPLMVNNALRERLHQFAKAKRVKGEFAFYVYDITANKPVAGYNETQALPSASCLKLLSGVAGLHLLGTNYCYTTSLFVKGRIENAVLKGDIILKGGLDPQLMSTDFARFAQILGQRGVQKIAGRVVFDLALTEPVESEEHWFPWDLSFAKYGIFYKGAPRVQKDFTQALRIQGIGFNEKQIVMDTLPSQSVCIYRYVRPIKHVIKRMWKNSSNTQSTALLYTIGKHLGAKSQPEALGIDYLRGFLAKQLDIKDSTIVVHDGCGLCTHNRLSPVALTRILQFGHDNPAIFDLLWSNLAIAGVDGTLAKQMTKPSLRGRIRAKTGTLSHPYGISSLAGYCVGSDGHLLAFATMQSQMSVLDARVLQQKLCEELVK